MDRKRTLAGFTLIELMIVVAIIGILASTATVAYSNYQNRSRRSEALYNLKAIATVETSYFAEAGLYLGAPSMPGPAPGAAPRPWTPLAEAAFSGVGWRPEGNVYFDYDVNAPGGPSLNPCPCPACFTASAYGDIDGDGMLAVASYVKPDVGGGFCPTSVTGHAPPVGGDGGNILETPAHNRAADDF
ncbi:MAG TPA: prepilin-type N-terminal cleavage/methylation domain-containing protein [Planctomycetota bacterium]|nr:prepilin-type N-terminal cleavage/methylation domain-containing protein [Planctomycetota bacterium]